MGDPSKVTRCLAKVKGREGEALLLPGRSGEPSRWILAVQPEQGYC